MRALCAAALMAALGADAAAGQRDTVVTPGRRYAAGSLHRTMLGAGYRDAWTTPIRVQFLDLDTVGGGLTPTERGGGNQTQSLHFEGPDGREYSFRSVDKNPVQTLGPDVEGTLAGAVLRDLVSAQHPGGQLAMDVLEDAVGVMHPPRRLYVMPDDPRLGEFREEFAGMLGYFEERPEEGATSVPAIAAAAEVEGDEDFIEALQSDARNRLDQRSYLTMRLLDLLVGDWDRHADQFRWARFEENGLNVWRPVPRDRDYVFAHYGGVGPSLARSIYPKAVAFGPDPATDLYGLIENAQALDRRLLDELGRADWDSVTAWVQSRVTDDVIDRAMMRLPREFQGASAASIAARLRERRENLARAARTLYGWMAVEPELHARDAADYAVADRRPDGSLEVRFAEAETTEPYFVRRFVPGETREVRIHLYGGDDRLVVRGSGPGRIGIRAVGGPGDDLLEDSSLHGDTRFYDHHGENRFVTRSGTRVDRREHEPPEWTRGRGTSPHRSWGRSSSFFTPTATWRSRIGPVVGGGPSWKDYGFRRYPFEDRGQLAVLYAPLENRVGVEYSGEYHFTGDRRWLGVDVRATGLAATDFYGFGNATPENEEKAERRFFERQLLVEPTWHFPISRQDWLSVGPTLEWRDPEPESAAIGLTSGAPGVERWAAAGARLALDLDRRDAEAFPRSGWRVHLAGDAFPAVRDLDGPFGAAEATATTYLSAGAGPVLALRGGGRMAWGDFPLQRAATIGGRRSLRGHAGDRFAGDAAAFGGAELRQPLFRANLVVRGTIGALGLADAGRVWVDGDSPGSWHTAVGGGVYFNFLEGSRTAALYVASGEGTRVYAHLGMPF